uniref:PspA/IM30 family protein n=1 Tax=Aeromonas caviae TaxID=648 RepID=UPI000D648E26
RARPGRAQPKGREARARAALIEKSKQAELADALSREQQAVDSGIEKLGEEIRQLEAKLEDARARQKAMAIRSEAASSRLNVQSQVARGDSQAVVSKFERMERRIDEMEARADLGQSDKALAQQFAELEADDQISRELEAMRQKLGQHNPAPKQGE